MNQFKNLQNIPLKTLAKALRSGAGMSVWRPYPQLEHKIDIEFTRLVFDNFDLLFGFAVVWCVIGFAGIALWRARQGAWHPPIPESQELYSERFVSGFSHKNLLTKLGGARNALSVKVSREAVLIELVAPFKWFIPRGVCDLEHYVTRKNIKEITCSSRWRREGIVLAFVSDSGELKCIEFCLRNRQKFLALFP